MSFRISRSQQPMIRTSKLTHKALRVCVAWPRCQALPWQQQKQTAVVLQPHKPDFWPESMVDSVTQHGILRQEGAISQTCTKLKTKHNREPVYKRPSLIHLIVRKTGFLCTCNRPSCGLGVIFIKQVLLLNLAMQDQTHFTCSVSGFVSCPFKILKTVAF